MKHDGLLYVNARGWQLLYNVVVILLLWLTQNWRSGHWYFDADSLTTPPNKRLQLTLQSVNPTSAIKRSGKTKVH